MDEIFYAKCDRIIAEVIAKEMQIKSELIAMHARPFDYLSITEEIMGCAGIGIGHRYLIERDIEKFINRHVRGEKCCSEGLSGLLKRMDMDGDGMVDRSDVQGFLNGGGIRHDYSRKLLEVRSEANLKSDSCC